jgi:hypothetical protein
MIAWCGPQARLWRTISADSNRYGVGARDGGHGLNAISPTLQPIRELKSQEPVRAAPGMRTFVRRRAD